MTAPADSLSTGVAIIAVVVLLWLVAGQVHLGTPYLRASLALVLFLAGSVVLGRLLTLGLPTASRTSLLLPVTMRDCAIAAGIATQAFGSAASAPLSIYGVLVLLFGAGTARYGNRNAHRRATA